MLDCHCHLCDKEFDQVGVVACLVNTENEPEFQKCLDLSERYPGFCIPCFGVHPVQYKPGTYEARSACIDDLAGVEEWLDKHHDKLVALGEVGLDFTPRYIHADSDKDTQRMVLKTQFEYSLKYNLPLIAHSRSAGKPIIDFLLEIGAKSVLLHAFSGNIKSAKAGIDAGFYFSVPPSVVHSDQKQSVFAKIPLDQLLLETDSPVLGPSKEERNEPANITHSVEWLAKAKNVDVETVKKMTTTNALRLFPKLKNLVKF